MGDWEWTPTGAFFMGVGVAALAMVFLAILVKIAINDQRAKNSTDVFSVVPVAPHGSVEVGSLNQRLQAIENRLAAIESLQRQQLAAIHDTLPAS